MAWISNPLITYLYFWGWRDFVELLFFVVTFYKVTSWLNKDKTRHLVSYIYCYCFLALGAFYLHLPIIWSFLLIYGPVIAMICILMHQEVLQKHLVTPIKIVPAHASTYWLDDLLQAFLCTMNAQRPVLAIIQHKNDLSSLLTTSFPLNTPVQKNILLTLFESKLFDHHALIHITSTGTLLGINCHWIRNPTTKSDNTALPPWETAMAAIAHNDALVVRGNPAQNTFDIALRGSLIERVTSANCRKIIHQFLHTAHMQQEKEPESLSKPKDNVRETNRP